MPVVGMDQSSSGFFVECLLFLHRVRIPLLLPSSKNRNQFQKGVIACESRLQDFNYRLSSFWRQFPLQLIFGWSVCLCVCVRVCVCVCVRARSCACMLALAAFGSVQRQRTGFLDILCIVTACAVGLAACKTVSSSSPSSQSPSPSRSGDIT